MTEETEDKPVWSFWIVAFAIMGLIGWAVLSHPAWFKSERSYLGTLEDACARHGYPRVRLVGTWEQHEVYCEKLTNGTEVLVPLAQLDGR